MYQLREVADRIIREGIEQENMTGANVLVMHRGKEILRASYGYADRERKVSMKDNTIFRLFSMSKPVTAVAVMMLAERGLIDLQDPVSRYIPEFGGCKVFEPDGSVRPARREITIWHLLNMTSGLPYPDAETHGGRQMGELFDRIKTELHQGQPTTTLEYCRQIAGVPLNFDPGEKWQYGLSADILGGVVEVASGRSFGQFLREELFEPLDMKDTGFYVPEDKWDRVAQIYEKDEQTGKLHPFLDQHLGLEGYRLPIAFESGGAGLVSTMEDYSHFAQMMLHGGLYMGRRILGRKTVEMMACDHLTPEQKVNYNWDSLRGYGYGCLMRVMNDPGEAGSNAGAGEFGWDGWTGTYVTMDPAEDFALIYMIQRCGAGTTPEVRKLRMAAYGVI